MTSLTRTFRQWWQPPRKAGEREEDRSVTFLELFYDLVYVVLIAQVARSLAEHVSLEGVGGFAFLFLAVWWAWFNGASYHDIHGNNDIRTRVFTFLQMLTVIAMAIFARDALGETSVGFAVSYAAFQLILTYLWWRTGVHDPDHRPLSGPYAAGFLLTTILFVASVFVPPPGRLYIWGGAMLISLVQPLYIFAIGKRNPRFRSQLEIILNVSPSLVERFGLFSIIVLGEVIAGVVGGVLEHQPADWVVGATAALGALVAVSLWWIYFDFVSHHNPHPTILAVSGWFYAHLPLTMGIAAAGAGIFRVVERAGAPIGDEVRWLLVGAVALVLVFIAGLMRTIQVPDPLKGAYRTGGIITLISGAVIGFLGLTSLEAVPLLILMVLLMLTPVFYGIKVWVRQFEGKNVSQI